ncbi:hypothetical protein [Agrococcus jejuensis]|uniref:Uncharacterized protein n=1 Tax=Agrococcus jejuensis TaxID=399736 RepID=A0A1G8E874_9MICO|nr:hypothetical protein [Agrococcus jejuensis]SDH66057.1 hypothetical protein SAMN04489720_1925 [Agrococcus jejuensis]
MSTTETAPAVRPRSIWSLVVCGLAIPAGAFAIAASVLHRFSGSWYSTPDPAGEVPWYWLLVGTAATLGVVAIVALGSRRWFAAVAAIGVSGVAGVLALGLHQEVSHLVDPPAVQVPMPCQCRSGGDCGCPGG